MYSGGTRGERLFLLNRITPFLDEEGLLRGTAFFYDDGRKLVFGSRRVFETVMTSTTCTEPSLESAVPPVSGSYASTTRSILKLTFLPLVSRLVILGCPDAPRVLEKKKLMKLLLDRDEYGI
jgi:hypothetical protein